MVVTALESERRDGGVRLQLDGRPFATVSASDAAELRLSVGRALDDAQVADLERRAERFAARVVATRILAARALPGGEIVKRLVRKGHGREVATAVVEELTAAGLVNDTEFARHYARTRAARGRYGPGRLVVELRRLGIAEDEARRAVDDALAAEGADVPALLREAAGRKLRAMAGLDRPVQARRLRAFLLRRGFASSDVGKVVKELLAG